MTSFHILLIIAAAIAVVLAAAAVIVDGLRIARETQTLSRDVDDGAAPPIPAARLQFSLSRFAGSSPVIQSGAEILEAAMPVEAPKPFVKAMQGPATRPQALAKALAVEEPEPLHAPLAPFPADERSEG